MRTKQVKIGKVGWFGRLLALHRSDPIGLTAIFPEPTIPEAWSASFKAAFSNLVERLFHTGSPKKPSSRRSIIPVLATYIALELC